MYLSSMMFLSDVEKNSSNEVYHCYQLIYTFGDKIKETNEKCIPICLFCFQRYKRKYNTGKLKT